MTVVRISAAISLLGSNVQTRCAGRLRLACCVPQGIFVPRMGYTHPEDES